MNEVVFHDITQAARLIEERRISPVELVQAVLSRAEEVTGRLNCFITILHEEALAAAQRAEAEIGRGEYRGPLHGIPFTVKDIIATKGIRTTCGSRILADWVPHYDATVVERLRDAGGVLLGKNHTHEFACGGPAHNPLYGPCRNPWNPEYASGGSTSGGAASVVSGASFAAIGSDTGGSIRGPAHYSGLVGLKPTYGLVSRYGVFPLSWSLDHVGPLTRTVADCALVLRAIAGRDPKDPSSTDIQLSDFEGTIGAGIRGVRVGVPKEFSEAATPEVRELVRGALMVLEELGAIVSEVSLPTTARFSNTVGDVITWSEESCIHQRWARSRIQEYGVDVRHKILVGAALQAHHYHRAQQLRVLIQREIHEALQDVDVLVNPAGPGPAAKLTDERGQLIAGREVQRHIGVLSMTRLYNLTGGAAIVVPCGFTSLGLPVGMQIASEPFAEPIVFRVARAYEQATDWHKRRPFNNDT